ncbi:MAG: amidohydrolase family protein [Clostridia bacterium]|nr:amidohydrolase family protein [Clostridia bacterium]
MSIIDIDAHPPIERAARNAFFEDLSRLGIGSALGAPLAEGMSERECNLRVLAEGKGTSLWGHPHCLDTLAGATLITVDAAWLPEVGDILSVAEKQHVPILLRHEGEDEIRALAAAYPILPLIVGGFDSRVGKPAIMAELMKAHKNLYLNLSGAVWSYNYVMHEWLERLPTDRILFGSAYPLGNPASKLASLRWELRDTDEAVAEAILGGNARTLFGEVKP